MLRYELTPLPHPLSFNLLGHIPRHLFHLQLLLHLPPGVLLALQESVIEALQALLETESEAIRSRLGLGGRCLHKVVLAEEEYGLRALLVEDG